MKKWQVAILIGAICLMLDWAAWRLPQLALGLTWVLTTFGGIVWFFDWLDREDNRRARELEQRRRQDEERSRLEWEAKFKKQCENTAKALLPASRLVGVEDWGQFD